MQFPSNSFSSRKCAGNHARIFVQPIAVAMVPVRECRGFGIYRKQPPIYEYGDIERTRQRLLNGSNHRWYPVWDFQTLSAYRHRKSRNGRTLIAINEILDRLEPDPALLEQITQNDDRFRGDSLPNNEVFELLVKHL